MDSLTIINFKAKKANSTRRSNPQLRKLTGLFRIIETCLVVALISRALTHLPVALKVSTVYLSSPRFVFFVGNAILIALFAKSGHFSAGASSATDLYDEFVEKRKRNQEKQSKTETGTSCEAKIYRRSRSERVEVGSGEKMKPELRRSVTEICEGRGADEKAYPEDKMSSEEFRSTIEAFIARQQRFRREETECSVF